VWHPHYRGRTVAELHETEGDFPWMNARVMRREGFEDVAELFAEEIRLLYVESAGLAVMRIEVDDLDDIVESQDGIDGDVRHEDSRSNEHAHRQRVLNRDT